MKKKFNMIFLMMIYFNTANLYAQSGWFFINPLPQNNSLYSLSFINSNTGFAVGDYGMILKTTNGGINWSRQSNPGIVGILRSVAGYDANNFIAVGFAGTSAVTTNGADWTFHSLNTNTFLFGAAMPSPDAAFAAGESGKIYKSTNGGINWFALNSGVNFLLTGISFLNANTGIVIGENGTILRTTDGGLNWNSLNPNSSLDFFAVNFINSNTGIIAGGNLDKSDSGIVIRTTNGGASWQTLIDGLSDILYSADMYDANNFICTGESGLICRTSDGGVNWNQQKTVSEFSINTVNYNDANNLTTAGFLGEILKSSNAGNNWYNVSKSATYGDVSGIDFIDLNTGYFCGENGVIFKTTNGGSDFTLQNSGASGMMNSVSMYNSVYGFSAGDSGMILKTTNGGVNWISQTTSTSKNLFPIYTQSFTNTCAVGEDGLILVTTNSGTNWLSISAGTTSNLNAVSFSLSNTNVGITAGDHGKIFKTINGGLNWSSLKSPVLANLNDVKMTDVQTAYILSPATFFLKTTNGGENWITLFEGDQASFLKFSVSDNYNIYLCGGGLGAGNVIRTTNGGLKWFNQYINTTSQLLNIEILNQDIALTVGQVGTILKTTTGGFPVGINNYGSNFPGQFELRQNYPNPFNPNTVLSYSLFKSSFVELKIYDILGNEIEKLTSEYLNAGYHEIRFSGSNLPSGVYFYKLKAGNTEVTKKMVLLR